MILWLSIVIIAGSTVALGLWPLIAGRKGVGALDHAVGHYEARQAELARQHAEGVISAGERQAAEAEQARRLLAIDRMQPGGIEKPGVTAARRKLAALCLLALVPAFSIGAYLAIGQPNMPDQPLASRQGQPAKSLDIDNALRKIEAHLLRNPQDGRGFEVVAPVYMRMERYEEASGAFRKVIALLGESSERFADLGESLVALGNGVINRDAKDAFSRALGLEAGHPKSRFYLALALEQDGDIPGAIERLVALAGELPESGPRQRVLAELERLQPAKAPPPSATDSEAGRAVAALPEAERQAVIRSMVEGLAARLSAQGGSLEEWQRLVQARFVLGERDLAARHLAAARVALGKDPGMLEQLLALENQLGLADARPEAGSRAP